MGIEVGVLGRLRIMVDGVVVEPPAQVAPLLVALAVPETPIRKLDLAREVLYLSSGSIDSRLSRLHRLLGVGTPLHRVPVPRSGFVELDRGAVSVDVDRFRSLVVEAESLMDSGLVDEALKVLLRADDVWRTSPFAWASLGDPEARTPFGQARDELLELRSHVREVAARLSVDCRCGLPLSRLVHWTREGEAGPSLWHARIDLPREPPAPVGREHEFAELWRHTRGVADGRGGVHVLAGGTGSGKSHLLAHLQKHAWVALGLPAVHVDVEENSGFHRVLREALTPLWQNILRRADPPREVLDRADEIAAFVDRPPLDEPKGVEGHEPMSPVHHAARLVGAVLRAIDQPVLVVLDNVHRAAPELLQVLSLVRQDSLGLVGVVASLRPDDCSTGMLADAASITVLEPFDLPSAGRFLSGIRGRRVEELEVECLYRRVGGMPLALLNVPDDPAFVSTGPSARSVTSTLGRWLELRPCAARRALGVAAVLAEGTRFDLTLAELILAGEPEAIDALSRELDAGIEVHRVDGVGAFTHRAWQEVAYASVEPHRRRALHRRVLEYLERQLATTCDPVEIASCAGAVAHHASRADRGGLATTIGVGALVRAADTLAPFETATAVALYRRALQIARPEEQLAILLRQGRTRRLAAEWDAAETDLRAAADLARDLPENQAHDRPLERNTP